METLRFLLATTFYPPYHLGGDAVHVQYLAEALAARGHEVHVEFSPAAYRLKRRGTPPRGPTNHDVRIHPIPSPFGRAQPIAAYAFGRSAGVSRSHEALVREIRPDVVHVHNISLLGLGVLKRPPDALMVYTAHDYWARCPRSDLLKYGKRPCETPSCVACCVVSRRPPQLWRFGKRWRGLPGLDLAIAPSRFMAGAIGPSLRCPVVHIPNFAPDPNPEGTLSEPEDYFLFVGVMEPHKGLPIIADAATRPGPLKSKIVGQGSLERSLKLLQSQGVARLDMEGWVSRERLSQLYRRARALLIPSIWPENAPLVAVEALAWGAPLLTSRRGGLEELLYGGATGRAFEPTGDGLVTAVEAFLADDLPHKLRSACRGAFVANHRPETYVDRYMEIVRKQRVAAPTPHPEYSPFAGQDTRVPVVTSSSGVSP